MSSEFRVGGSEVESRKKVPKPTVSAAQGSSSNPGEDQNSLNNEEAQVPSDSPLIVALDVATEKEVIQLCQVLRGRVEVFKVGMGLFLSLGKRAVDLVHSLGGKVFLDLKFYDIPSQVAASSREAVKMGVEMFTVHALGGLEMMSRACQAAQEEAQRIKVNPPSVLGVTILTSLDQNDLSRFGVERNLTDEVLVLASLAQEAGLDGVVASAKEISTLRKTFGVDFLVVTPGVRLPGQESHDKNGDQKRITTPFEAIKKGASYVVMGRPLISSPDPAKLVAQLLARIKGKNP